ncbi:hypothetical protein EPUL_005161 [Erysiphe pulchra]|uniref:Pre-C2HC domain-containing protein n=1 Tax=Erysiphe pulchra TaxID=225359 RepID=A0A2S4PNB5_9PEZI|nr:hypothetical protein EPUL_005161 [Erysiphe pulchra]
MFQAIACAFDDAIDENIILLPQHLQKPFKDFVVDLSSVAQINIECHVRGTQKPPKIFSSANATQTTISNLSKQKNVIENQLKPNKTYASAVMTPSMKQHTKPQVKTEITYAQMKPKTLPASKPEENRLLVRISPGHPALSSSPYAIMLELNAILEEKLVKEIQIIKTGFAICPVSLEAQEKLVSRMGEIEASLSNRGQCKVEKPGQHVAYRLSCVPRNYTILSGNSLEMKEITATVVSEALTDLTNISPINVLESRGSANIEYISPLKSWIVIYPKGSTLSSVLSLFGVRVTAKILPQRFRTPQCGRCFGWHNERACSRLPRCRICASTNHVESGHTSCDPSRDHFCPPKCANCHGPHTADSLECLIRPNKNNKLPSKVQISEFRKAAAAVKLRLRAAYCENIESHAMTATQDINDLLSEYPSTSGGKFAALAPDSLDVNSTLMNEN